MGGHRHPQGDAQAQDRGFAGARTGDGADLQGELPDIRNTKVADLVAALGELVGGVTVFDPHADPAEAEAAYGIALAAELPQDRFEAVVLAVRHAEFQALGGERLRQWLAPGGIVYDIKQVLPVAQSDARL